MRTADGIDWDLEGTDDSSSDINNFTVDKIKLIATSRSSRRRRLHHEHRAAAVVPRRGNPEFGEADAQGYPNLTLTLTNPNNPNPNPNNPNLA